MHLLPDSNSVCSVTLWQSLSLFCSNKNTAELPPTKSPSAATHSRDNDKTNSPPPANCLPQTQSLSTDARVREAQCAPQLPFAVAAKQIASAPTAQKTVRPSTPHKP